MPPLIVRAAPLAALLLAPACNRSEAPAQMPASVEAGIEASVADVRAARAAAAQPLPASDAAGNAP